MMFLRAVKRCRRINHVSNENIKRELGILIVETINEYREEWRGHVNRTDEKNIPKQILNYHSERKKNSTKALE